MPRVKNLEPTEQLISSPLPSHCPVLLTYTSPEEHRGHRGRKSQLMLLKVNDLEGEVHTARCSLYNSIILNIS